MGDPQRLTLVTGDSPLSLKPITQTVMSSAQKSVDVYTDSIL